jgi:hypothetical protein
MHPADISVLEELGIVPVASPPEGFSAMNSPLNLRSDTDVRILGSMWQNLKGAECVAVLQDDCIVFYKLWRIYADANQSKIGSTGFMKTRRGNEPKE